MAKKRQYTSVSDVLRDIAPDDKFGPEVDARIARRRLVKHLLALRAAKGLSQKDIADRLGCTQSRVSKLENGCDDDVRLRDLVAYCDALGLHCGIVLSGQHPTAVDQIKYHAFSIRTILQDLVDLVGQDQVMSTGVAKLHIETLVNLVRLVAESAEKLPNNPETEAPYIRIGLAGGEHIDDTAPQDSCPRHDRNCDAVV
jgi:transcriptional regulator with XRE-family HTH domain